MAELSASSLEVSQRIHTYLDEAKEELGIKRVYYGRTDLIPDYPAITVEPGTKQRSLELGSTHKFRIDFAVEIFLYFGKISNTAEINFEENERLTELVEEKLHENFRLDGMVIFGFVTSIEPGTTLRSQEMIKVSRITWEAQSRQLF